MAGAGFFAAAFFAGAFFLAVSSFPPTDFFNYGKPGERALGEGVLKGFKAPFDFNALDPKDKVYRPVDEAMRETLGHQISPITHVTPDDPPTQFRWRGQLHRVRRAEGPERVAEEWWKREIETVSTGHVRDYYRVEDADGGRFWLFRAGLYEPGAPAKWWLHGLFG